MKTATETKTWSKPVVNRLGRLAEVAAVGGSVVQTGCGNSGTNCRS